MITPIFTTTKKLFITSRWPSYS